MRKKIQFAPLEIFEQILTYMVIPTFDLVIEYGNQGVIIVRRKIKPYKELWALPGLRMFKGEGIDDTLRRIAHTELGLTIDTTNKVLVGQFVGKFRSEFERQDISTCYLITVSEGLEINPNREHFYSYRITKTIPNKMGAMYKYYLKEFLKRKSA